MSKKSGSAAVSDTKQKKVSPGKMTLIRLLRNPNAKVALVILGFLIIMAILANWIRPYDPTLIDLKNKCQGPSLAHPFGTDQMGRDILSRIMVGAKYSLCLGLFNSGFSAIFGLLLGSICGFFGGRVDLFVMRILDIISSIPGMLLAIVVSAVLGNGFWQTILAIGIAGMPVFARVSRASIMSVRGSEYIEASILINCSTPRTIISHVLPNAISPIIVQFSMSIASCITMAATLSFIGLGVQPPTPEWGAMLSNAKDYVREYPYMMIIPGLFLMVTVLAINLLGDALRDAMDPKLNK